jgi:hypothetical protein
VYALCDQAAIPFYIGKGKGARIERHEKKAANGANTYTARKIRSIWSGGGEVQRQILWSGLTEQEAFENERFAIATLGRENLTNATDGGEGIAGFSHSEEARRRIALGHLGRKDGPPSDEARRNMSLARRGKKLGPQSEETRRKIGDANRGRAHTEETKTERVKEERAAAERLTGNGAGEVSKLS